MSIQFSIDIGHTKIRLSVEGCVDCGTLWSSGWTVAKVVSIKIGSKEGEISLHRCIECMQKKPQEVML